MAPLLLSWLFVAGSPQSSIDRREPLPVLLLFVGPDVEEARPTRQALRDVAEAKLTSETGLELWHADRLGIDSALQGCEATRLFGCWVESAIERRAVAPVWILAIAVQPLAAGGDRVEVMALDVAAARAVRLRSKPEAVEAALFSSMLRAPPTTLARGDAVAARAVLDRALTGPLSTLASSGSERARRGAVRIDASTARVEVELDARAVSTVDHGSLVIEGLVPGLRRLVLSSGGEAQSFEMGISATSTASLGWAPPSGPPGSSELEQQAFLIAGATAGLGGLVVAAIGVGRGLALPRGACVSHSPAASGECEALGFATFGQDDGAAPTTDPQRVNPDGIPILGIGVAFLAAGTTWILSETAFLDAERPCWLRLFMGLGAGLVGYLLVAWADPR